METTLLLAKVLGVYFLVSGAFLIFRRKTFALLLKDMFEHRAISYVVGVVLVFGGAFLVFRKTSGTDPLSVFVLLMSWAILIKGIIYILAPEWLYSLVKTISRTTLVISGVIVALLGFYLLVFLA